MIDPEFTSEPAVTFYFWQLISLVAERLRVDRAFLAPYEQLEEIGRRNPAVHDTLQKYLDAYRQWAAKARGNGDDRELWDTAQKLREKLVSLVERPARFKSKQRSVQRGPAKKKR